MRRVVPSILLLVVVAAFGLQKVAGDDPAASSPGGERSAHVVRVVDGDTIRVVLDGASDDEPVRYIGIDTPETVKPRTPVECFGKKASALNRALVDGREVRLVFDAEERDRYGRLLAYVYRAGDGLFVNAELVRRGYATAATFPPNVRFAERFRGLAAAARQAGRGLWSACER